MTCNMIHMKSSVFSRYYTIHKYKYTQMCSLYYLEELIMICFHNKTMCSLYFQSNTTITDMLCHTLSDYNYKHRHATITPPPQLYHTTVFNCQYRHAGDLFTTTT
ncbi:hypothetical protein Hanom_Chr00s000003g01601691 [Helianthus anomalus]